MPLCITCSQPLPHLYTTYSKADDKALGKGVRLTQCPNCKRFADKYVEHDYVVLFIDLVLIKPQVYRHLLFNRLDTPLPGAKDSLDPSILRLGVLLILFDVYITWARIEKGNAHPASGSRDNSTNVLTSWPILGQYLFFLTLNVVATVTQHLTIRFLAQYLLRTAGLRDNRDLLQHSRTSSSATATKASIARERNIAASHSRQASSDPASPVSQATQHRSDFSQDMSALRPGHASPSAISTALLVSSCTKLFPILLVIWPTSSATEGASSASTPFVSRATSYIGWVVLVNNIEALLILLDCGYAFATGLAVAGMVSRFVVEGWLLGLVGLQRDGGGPIGDLLDTFGWMRRGSNYG